MTPGSAREIAGRSGPDRRRRSLEVLLGDRVAGLTDATPPWETRTRTWIATLADGERVVAQWTHDRRALARRLRMGRRLPVVAPWIPVPAVLACEVRGADPVLVTRFVHGQSGRELMDDDEAAALLGRRMGELATGLRRVPARGLRLSTLWGDPERLAAAGRGWLEDGRSALGAPAATVAERLLECVPAELCEAQPVFAHGDLAPVNVLFSEGALVALLDFERARVAHPLFDAAWWRWIVRIHHPERWNAAGPAFFAGAGITFDAATVAHLDLLAVLQCLEMLYRTPRRRVVARTEWAARVAAVLDWS